MKDKSYYYTPDQWSRSIGYGPLPDERNAELQAKYEADDGALTEEQTNQILKEVKETKRCNTKLKSSMFGPLQNK